MIISNQQVMQLITMLCQQMAIMAQIPTAQAKQFYDNAEILLCDIANQQSEELKEIE